MAIMTWLAIKAKAAPVSTVLSFISLRLQSLRRRRQLRIGFDVAGALLCLFLAGLDGRLDVGEQGFAERAHAQERTDLLLQPPWRRPLFILRDLVGHGIEDLSAHQAVDRREHGLLVDDFGLDEHAIGHQVEQNQVLVCHAPGPRELGQLALARIVDLGTHDGVFGPARKDAIQIQDGTRPHGRARGLEFGLDEQEQLDQVVAVDPVGQALVSLSVVGNIGRIHLRAGFGQINQFLRPLGDFILDVTGSFQLSSGRRFGFFIKRASNATHGNNGLGRQHLVHA